MWDDEPRRPEVEPAATATWGTVLIPSAAIAVGVLADLVIDGPAGIGVAALIAMTATGLVVLARPRLPGVIFAVEAVIVGAFVAIRASAPLAALDIAVAAGLLCWSAGFARSARPGGSARAYLRRGLSAVGAAPDGLRLLASPSAHVARSVDGAHVRAIPRALVVVVPVTVLLLGLLASADAVYAHLLRTVVDGVPLGTVPRHLAVIGASALGFATLVACAARPDRAVEPPLMRRLTPPEWKLLLGAVDLLFSSFVIVQAATIVGGSDRLLAGTGVTVAEYARSGFFQLLAVAAITAAVLTAVASWGRRTHPRDERAFVVLAAIMILLTLAILAASFQRLMLYEETFGLTWLRLAVHTTILVLGAAFVSGLAAVLMRRATWLPTVVVAIGMAGVLGLNLLNPDAFIAERNLARVARGHDLDTALLRTLAADAVPALVRALPGLPASEARAVGAILACERDDLEREARDQPWSSINLARVGAFDVLRATALRGCIAHG